ncbi:MAG: HAD-IB family phosphatase [Anaerolineae bacterium]
MRWPVYKHVFFDCDSTLTAVEGIDILAAHAGKQWRVEVLTRAAMDGDLDLEEIYAKRLQAVRPTREQIRQIRRDYKRRVVADARALINTLQALGHEVYIISGGLAEPVIEFGAYLGVPKEHIRAVSVSYNRLSGHWWQNGNDPRYLAYEPGALTVSDGKAQIIREFMAGRRGRSLLIGDGNSDLLAGTAVNLFVGFGGVAKRERVLAEAPAFIHTPSLAPLLPLAAGPAALSHAQDPALAAKAAKLIQKGAITFQNERLNQKFQQAYQAIYSRTNGSQP